MIKNKQRKPTGHIHSREPYKRRSETEIIKIVKEIQSGLIGIRASCRKHGLCRLTLQKWIARLSVRTLGSELSNKLLANMSDDQKLNALEKKVRELTKALELEKLKNDSLKTMIKVAEENLHIKIRKKPGTKQSKE